MVEVIGVQFKKQGKIYYFHPQDLELPLGTEVIVETARGQELGRVISEKKEVAEEEIKGSLMPILRIVNEEDQRQHLKNKNDARLALAICEEKIRHHKLEMELISSEYTFDRSKLLFYFSANHRVDFRELVRDLAAEFRTRIELRQIGVRDEAKLLGGIGCCGRVCCCTSFLSEFAPVTIKMAKDQNLSINPVNISGICGRLMCCLKYEQEGYEEKNKKMPRVGVWVGTPLGRGEVVENLILKEQCRVRVTVDDAKEIHTFPVEDLSFQKKYAISCPHADRGEGR
ncbi:MAG: stage 0 sporulation family protein [Tissierellia bacterium]|nr:stage 0 sporulation family protein [Tissierellia bacterium]